jgi:hypothetical protein
MTISIALEFKELKKQLEEFEYELPKNIVKKMMTAVFTPMRRDARKIAPERSGRLKAGLKYWAFNDWAGALTTWGKKKGGVKTSIFYASTVEHGAQVHHAKSHLINYVNKKNRKHVLYQNKYLTFKINGEWKKVKSVNIPAKPFMQPSFNKYFGGDATLGLQIMDRILQKEMAKILDKEQE